MQAVILAAGFGKRLRPVTKSRSKAMVPVLGRPLVERALLPLVAIGVREFIFVVSPEDREIRKYFSHRTTLDISVKFVVQEERLGMAHALGMAAPFLSGRFLVSACDSLINELDARALLAKGGDADAALSLLDVPREMVSKSAAVEMEGDRIRRIVEKPLPHEAPSLTVSLPHYVFSLRLLDFLSHLEESPRGEYEIQDAIQALINEGSKVVGVRAAARLQVSTPEDLLLLTRRLLLEGEEPKCFKPLKVGSNSKFFEPLRVESGVEIGDECSVGPEVFLESGCRIGDRAVVRRSIVLRGGRIAAGETVEDRVVT